MAVAETAPRQFFRNPKPILFDEWQDVPKIWGAIRKDCDDDPESVGSYYLTGSSSKKIETPHTGTGRISELTMYPMTLWEMGESNGTVSLTRVIENADYEFNNAISKLTLDRLFFIVCQGGWPRCMVQE